MQLEGYQEQIMLCRALQELDGELVKAGVKPFTLHVVGGFALLLQQIRQDTEAYTDIDYVGQTLSDEIQSVIREVGLRHGFGSDWINNDMLLSGSSLKDLEFTTGKLHFSPKMQLDVLRVNVLDKNDLLKLKLIAIDTALTAVDFNGDFTRVKDFKDIALLMQDLHMHPLQLRKYQKYLIHNQTLRVISDYCQMIEPDKDSIILDKIQSGIYKEPWDNFLSPHYDDYIHY